MAWQENLEAALVDAFQPPEFDRMLAHISRRRTDYHAGGGSFPDMARAVIAAADGGGWVRDLVRGALWFKSGNALLQRLREADPWVAPTLLKQSEAGEIAAGIKSAFPGYQDLANLVDAHLGQTLDLIVERFASEPPADATARLVAWFDRRGAVASLIDTCARVRPEPVLLSAAKKVLAAIKSREVAVGFRLDDPYDTCLVDRQVFLDRQALRAVLRGWSPPPRKRVLVVNGPARSGKTYTLQLLRHIAVQMKTIQIANIDLADEDLALFVPGMLARSVMLQMGRDSDLSFMPKLDDAGSGARWARELCVWLVSAARRSATTWVIALDGSHQAQLRDETRDMIRELIKRASVADSPLRVVLLGYTDDLLPMDVRNQVAAEQLQALTAQDLRDYLGKVVDQLGVDDEHGVIEEIVKDVTARTALASIETVAAEVQRWIDRMQSAPS